MSEAPALRLLIADDQDLIRDGLAAILERQDDMTVVGLAADGGEAVELARELRPDVTLMDLRMPRIDGLEAARQLLSDQPPPTRVLVLTTFDEDDLVIAALRVGASGFLLKDTPRHHLVESIRAVMEGDLRLAPSITRRIVEHRLRSSISAADQARLATLTERERDVLRAIAGGATNPEIAADLYLSESTVKTHVGHLLQKLGMRDRVQLVILAYDAGIVP